LSTSPQPLSLVPTAEAWSARFRNSVVAVEPGTPWLHQRRS
jgi:hypothetical protein